MHICFLIENAWHIGGGDYAQFKYAEYLALRGHRVTVFAQHRQEFMDQLQPSPNLTMYIRPSFPPAFRGAGRLNQLWGRTYTRMRIRPFIRNPKSQPDVLVGYSKKSSILTDRMSRMSGIPCAHVVFETPEWMSRALGSLFDDIHVGEVRREWAATREVYQRADQLLPNSELTRREVERWTGRAVEPAVYAGLDDPGEPTGDTTEGRHILYVGRLDVTKNVHDLIDAVALMKDPPPLIIAGRGHDEEELKRRVDEKKVNASFPGHISDQVKWRLLRECLFLVFPTSFEGFGMPPGEALSCGKPAICSDIPILREVYGDTVEYFPLHDVSALAEKMQAMLAAPEYRRERGSAGRAFVTSRYTWTHCAERMENSLKAIVEGTTS